MHAEWKRICAEFMIATSYEEEGFDAMWEARRYDPAVRPETYLRIPEALHRVSLGEPLFPPAPDLWDTLKTRRSKRNFLPSPLSLNELNVILWSTQGITADMGDYQLRTAPSAGALYPVETYLVVNQVEDLQPGLYHLDVKGWTLECLQLGDMREAGHRALRTQAMTRLAPVNFIWTAMMDRCLAKYHERAYRYVWWDSATIGENFLLAAHALGLGACLMGSWYDDRAHALLGIDGTEQFSVLTGSVGRVQGKDWRADRRPPARDP